MPRAVDAARAPDTVPTARRASGLVYPVLALPWLLTYNEPPSPTFLNQAAAWAAWGLALLVLLLPRESGVVPAMRWIRTTWPLLLVFGVTALAAATAPLLNGHPSSLAWSTLVTVLGCVPVLLAGAALAESDRVGWAARFLYLPLLIAALASVPVALIQVFHAEGSGTWLVAGAAFSERASGNLRQPNHLSSLALWGIVALAWLHEARPQRRMNEVTTAVALSALLLVATIVLTGSRTGLVGLFVLALWGLVDRGLSGRMRMLLAVLPLLYGLGWWLFRLWAMRSLGDAEAVDRIAPGADYSSARFAIWSNAVDLIRRHPWFGVGLGDFNFAWTLTPFPGRPQQFYDHTHNLPLHWLVELGVPIGTALIAATLHALWRGFGAVRAAAPADRVALRAAFVLVLLVGLHSLLEYPLWYAYFLLPTTFAFGVCLGSAPRRAAKVCGAGPKAGRRASRLLALGAAAMLAGAALAVLDYRRVAVIFAPSPGAAPLDVRIADGMRSMLFAHHAHYAAATTDADPRQAIESFGHAGHFLLDTRLMTSAARAYAAVGDLPRARHLADRLREFELPAVQDFFADCRGQRPDAAPALPFQCQPADVVLDWRAFRAR